MTARTLAELTTTSEPAWPLVREWIAGARHPVEVLPAERSQGERTLLRLQVTTRSPLGAVALETAGVFIDHGWLRILGAGGRRIRDGLLAWNGMGDEPLPEPLDGGLLIAHDAVGGFFASNGGCFPGPLGATHYFAPDRLRWEDLGLSYSEFLSWALTGDLATFYADVRWPGWERDAARLSGDQGIAIYPFLWGKGEPVAGRSRRTVPMRELWALHRDVARQLNGSPTALDSVPPP